MVKNSTGDKRITSVSKLFGAILCVEKLETVVYIISFSFLFIPAAAPCLPFVTEFEPLQIVVRETFTFIPMMNAKVAWMASKIFAMFIYTVYALHAGAVVLYILLVFTCIGGCVLRLSTVLKREANTTINQDFVATSRALNKLQTCIDIYRILQIVTSISRQITKDMIGALIVISGVLTASSAYFIIYLYTVVPFIMYLACVANVVLSFATIFILIALGSLPNAHTTLFRQRWKWIRLSKMLRLQLESCGPVGFSLGSFVRITTAKTSIVIADTLLNCIATMVLMAFLTFWRTLQLKSTWETNRDMVQLGTLLILLALVVLGYSWYYYFKQFNEDYAYLITQLCQQLPIVKNSTGDKEITSISKLFGAIMCVEKLEAAVYIFSFSFLCITATAPGLPFVTEFEPLQIAVREFFTSILSIDAKVAFMTSKIFAMFIYIFLAHHGVAVALYLYLSFICIAGCIFRLSSGLKREANATINQDFVLTSRDLKRLQKSIEIYRVLQILTSISRQISKDMFGALIVTGAVIAACSAYFVIYLYSTIPFTMYLACAINVFLSFAIPFILIKLGSLPNAHTTLFKQRWRSIRISKRLRLQLESCGPVGFSIGNFVTIATEKTAIVVADILLNCISTMVLMGDVQHV
ncbi:unnamed protein product [Orchesella dallaii]|uniref:Gustatory receptor n=1 Tax=Orchesella dallaii TaxID=48710 RepID=A0ABP1R9B5_9HEXA